MSDTKTNVVDLGAHIPKDVREAARAAYIARIRLRAAEIDNVNAMRRLSRELKRFHLRPEQIQIGELDGRAMVPAMDWYESDDQGGHTISSPVVNRCTGGDDER